MKYCKVCKTIFKDTETHCSECGKKLAVITDVNEPVRLCIVGGTERAMLCGLLDDAEIPYLENKTYPQGLTNEIVTGYDIKLSNISLLVPFSALPKASELLGSVETVNNPVEHLIDDVKAHVERIRTGTVEDESSMSPAMRTTIKVVSAIAFLIIVALVVLGTDKITEFFKGLFGG